MLFHGTSKIDPKLIYSGKEGFDIRFSQGGMWGKANYFSPDASYSASSAYQNDANEMKQMFYARVMIGNTIKS